MIRGFRTKEETKTQAKKREDELEEEIVLEILREGRGEREERGERDEWNHHVGWHRKEDVVHRKKQQRQRQRQRQREPRSQRHYEQDHPRNEKKENYIEKIAVVVDQVNDRRNNHAIEEITRHNNVGDKADVLYDHGSDHSLRKNTRHNRSIRYGTETASLPWLSSSSFVNWAILATVFFGFVVWWSIRRKPSRLRSFRRRNTKGRTL